MKTILKILILLILVFLAVNFFIFKPEKNVSENTEFNISNQSSKISETIAQENLVFNESQKEIIQNKTGSQTKTGIKCLDDYNLTKNTIIFYYQNELHSNNMKPIVQQLQPAYKFFLKDSLFDNAFNSCFGYEPGVTPTFVCASTNAQITGEKSKTELENFAKSCSSS
jgi:uncharacterized protein YxeA